MFEIIKRDFIQGIKTFKFWSTVVSDRIKIELNILKLIKEINTLNQKKEELLKSIGKEIYDLSDLDLNIKENQKILSLVRQIREIDREIEDKRNKFRELEDISVWKF